jgi:hypothetical protein
MSKTKYTIYWDCLEQFGISYQTRYYLIAKIKSMRAWIDQTICRTGVV